MIYGAGAMNDHKAAKREAGWSTSVRYTGIDAVTRQVFAFWSSARTSPPQRLRAMPYMRPVGPRQQLPVRQQQELGKGSNMYTDPWATTASALRSTTSRYRETDQPLTFVYVHGNNSPGPSATPGQLQLRLLRHGQGLTSNEYVMGLNSTRST